ncbi:hypothetical protein OESDEN_16939 [Oesophagostomum dentatum]|uniref:Uncharacterized protein n=1 Tax=Oesophagostomum dentatum TaxID=61180 RepID=A0A0B1SEK2_OESDE|nr:hypothetical protein OESDEN_16939 [Oesophagostomum dentatum]
MLASYSFRPSRLFHVQRLTVEMRPIVIFRWYKSRLPLNHCAICRHHPSRRDLS